MWLVRRTRAIFRSAEFGFFGVIVRTIVQTPRFWGAPRRSSTCRPLSEFHVVRSAGVSTFLPCGLRPLRTSCEIVGTIPPLNELQYAPVPLERGQVLRVISGSLS